LPCGPCAPVAPTGPCAPVAPTAPDKPCGPEGPDGPGMPMRCLVSMRRFSAVCNISLCHLWSRMRRRVSAEVIRKLKTSYPGAPVAQLLQRRLKAPVYLELLWGQDCLHKAVLTRGELSRFERKTCLVALGLLWLPRHLTALGARMDPEHLYSS
jgi:hypothetical protein